MKIGDILVLCENHYVSQEIVKKLAMERVKFLQR